MANKTRTPAPPKRPVQAPKRRDTRKSAPVSGPGWLWGMLAGLAIAGIAAGLFFAFRGGGGQAAVNQTAHQGALAGLQKGPAPWQPEIASLAFRLQDLGFPVLGQEALQFHIHQHLDIFVNGKKTTVPALIGINEGGPWLTVIHTHDASGVIHVESPVKKDYTLGQVFDVWGVRFTRKCIGSYCTNVRVYVNGKKGVGNPRTIVLENHEEIAIVIGKAPAKIPATWPFAKNGL